MAVWNAGIAGHRVEDAAAIALLQSACAACRGPAAPRITGMRIAGPVADVGASPQEAAAFSGTDRQREQTVIAAGCSGIAAARVPQRRRSIPDARSAGRLQAGGDGPAHSPGHQDRVQPGRRGSNPRRAVRSVCTSATTAAARPLKRLRIWATRCSCRARREGRSERGLRDDLRPGGGGGPGLGGHLVRSERPTRSSATPPRSGSYLSGSSRSPCLRSARGARHRVPSTPARAQPAVRRAHPLGPSTADRRLGSASRDDQRSLPGPAQMLHRQERPECTTGRGRAAVTGWSHDRPIAARRTARTKPPIRLVTFIRSCSPRHHGRAAASAASARLFFLIVHVQGRALRRLQGDGLVKIEMHFRRGLSRDVAREALQRETLEIR